MTLDPPTDAPLAPPDWLAERLDRFRSADSDCRLVEVNVEPERYDEAHIPGAVSVDWQRDLRDTGTFDIVGPEALADLLGSHGIDPETTVVLYGDFYNWFAAHAYWLLTHYRHGPLLLLDGGRKYWRENGYPTTAEGPSVPTVAYDPPAPDPSVRADREDVETAIDTDTRVVDVRAPPEYRGDIVSPPGWNEGVQRGGHVPGAENVPWSRAVRTDGRFKSREQLAGLYADVRDDVILYCRIGERSAHTWFVLHELLEVDNVRHYYGSWVEWGNTVGLPVECPAETDLRSGRE